MRLFLALFAFLALGLAPLGMPAEARSTENHCAEMAGMDHHQQKPDHGGTAPVKSCCTAMAAALPETSGAEQALILRAPVVAMSIPVQHGLHGEVEARPPRS